MTGGTSDSHLTDATIDKNFDKQDHHSLIAPQPRQRRIGGADIVPVPGNRVSVLRGPYAAPLLRGFPRSFSPGGGDASAIPPREFSTSSTGCGNACAIASR